MAGKTYVVKGTGKKLVVSKKPKAMQKATLAKQIRKISRQQALGLLETKFVRNTGNATFNSTINGGFAEMYQLIPKVGQGTDDWERVNNDLQPINIRTDWHVGLSTASRSMNIRCVLYCLQHKSIKHFPDLAVYLSGPSFLKSGTVGSTQIYSGLIADEDLPINKEEFTLLKKFKFNLISNVGQPNGDTVAGNAPNTLPTYKKLSYTYACKRQLRYTPGGGTADPNGHAPFWVFGYSHTDGTGPDLTFKDVNIQWNTQMTYKDA